MSDYLLLLSRLRSRQVLKGSKVENVKTRLSHRHNALPQTIPEMYTY